MNEPLLSVRDLTIRYRSKDAVVHAVDQVSLDLHRGELLALVGESGSGKSTVGMAILRLLSQQADVLGGTIRFAGEDLLGLDERSLRAIRGRRIAMIFQDPVAGLNPVLSVGDQVAEILVNHLHLKKKVAKARAIEILQQVGLSDPERVARSYPFQLSGGMCQRVMIGIATALDPEVIVADEPTSALDVTIQAQILHQLDTLRRTRGTAILLITHDLGVVAQVADRVAVMYAGRVVETGGVMEILQSPLHPYSHGLLAALPRVDAPREQLPSIAGHPAEMSEAAEHCPFMPRCMKTLSVCRAEPPPGLLPVEGPAHAVACYNPIWRG